MWCFLHGGIYLPLQMIIYVNMQDNYIHMKFIYVNMQDNYVDMHSACKLNYIAS